MQFLTCAICKTCNLQTLTISNTCNLQHVQFATCAICNMCNLQHVQFATHGICNKWNFQYMQFATCAICNTFNLKHAQFATRTICNTCNLKQVYLQFRLKNCRGSFRANEHVEIFCLCKKSSLKKVNPTFLFRLFWSVTKSAKAFESPRIFFILISRHWIEKTAYIRGNGWFSTTFKLLD